MRKEDKTALKKMRTSVRHIGKIIEIYLQHVYLGDGRSLVDGGVERVQ